MNLIEQLGGYNKCKDLLLIPNIDTIMNAQGLREALLQHRRQNNILEVGDKIFLAETGEEMQVVCEKNKELYYNLGFTHATDDEIKVGYKL